jgi:heme/copper-type cytochrome/quinol oxidase subunit 1
MPDEGLGRLHFWLAMIGFNLTFFPMHMSGMYGMPRRTWTYAAALNVEIWNQLSTIGGLIFGVSALVWVWVIVRSLKRGEPAGHNPWQAASLEWATHSPPHHYNFAALPRIRHRDPLWRDDDRTAIEEATLAAPEVEPETWVLVMTGRWWAPLIGLAFTAFGVYSWAFEDPFRKKP